MQQGFFYDYSNYGSYERLTNDGISQWHPAFLALGAPIEICARAYRRFCQGYKPKPKPPQKSHWGAKLKLKRKPRKPSPGQTRLPWDNWEGVGSEIQAVAMKFVLANCLNPEVARTRYKPNFIPPEEKNRGLLGARQGTAERTDFMLI